MYILKGLETGKVVKNRPNWLLLQQECNKNLEWWQG